MSESETTTVLILDRPFQVAVPKDERTALDQAAKMLDTRMRDIRSRGKVIGIDRIAIMAALNLANELLQANNQQQQYIKRVESLNQRINTSIAENSELEF